jgi:hypothetical protein
MIVDPEVYRAWMRPRPPFDLGQVRAAPERFGSAYFILRKGQAAAAGRPGPAAGQGDPLD